MRENSPAFEPQIDAPRPSGFCGLCHEKTDGELCPSCNEIARKQQFWFDEAQQHRRTCSECYIPIIDDEGNPGLLSECCSKGLEILKMYMRYDKLLGECMQKRKD